MRNRRATPPRPLEGAAVVRLDDGDRLVPSRSAWPGSATYLRAAVDRAEGAHMVKALHQMRRTRAPHRRR